MPDRRFDCVVIGAGVIGLAVALELLRRECSVVVLDRGSSGSGATQAAGGMLAPASEAESERASLVALGLDSLERYPGFVSDLEQLSGLDCGYRREGSIRIALDTDEREALEHFHESLRQKGIEALPLSGKQARELEPHLSPGVSAALRIEQDHQVDPRALVRAMTLALECRGGRLICGARVEAVERAAGELEVKGHGPGDRPFAFDSARVVLAAGAWCEKDIRLPLRPLGVRPVKGQLVRLRGEVLLQRVIRTEQIYLIPRRDGELLIGATSEEMGFESRPTGGAVMELLRRGWQALPGIFDLEFVEVSVGLRSAVTDHLPLIGATETDGLYLAVGHHRNGILLAPATAHHLCNEMLDGRRSAALSPFAPDREADPRRRAAVSVEGIEGDGGG